MKLQSIKRFCYIALTLGLVHATRLHKVVFARATISFSSILFLPRDVLDVLPDDVSRVVLLVVREPLPRDSFPFPRPLPRPLPEIW